MDKNTNVSKYADQPAFPVPDTLHGNSHVYPSAYGGMSLRAYIATAALPGLMGRDWSMHKGTDEELITKWAVASVKIADELIAELAKSEK